MGDLRSPSPVLQLPTAIVRRKSERIIKNQLQDVSFNSSTSSEDSENSSLNQDNDCEYDGDGTNSTLNTLTEGDIIYVQENRQQRSTPNYQEVRVAYNYENYMKAGTRIKYRPTTLPPPKPEAKRVKPRKGNRTGKVATDSLPEKSISNFSITAEIARVTLDESKIITRKHEQEIDDLLEDISKDFPRWQYILRENFNIILFGYGSKVRVIRNFQTFLNDEFMVVPINGFFPKLNLKKFLIEFWEALDLDDSFSTTGTNILAMADDLYTILTNIDHVSIYFIVHSLDRLALNQPKFLRVLFTLSKVKYIHVIATVDHVNTGLGIGHSAMVTLNPYWINCTTFAAYDHELSCLANKFGDLQEDDTAKSSLEQVLKSLTANARKAFKILSNLQLESLKGSGQTVKTFGGIQFSEVLRKCREAFVAHGETPLRALLTEFVDHHLVKYAGKGKKIDNRLIVDVDSIVLEGVLAKI